jgi:hypothetical protein
MLTTHFLIFNSDSAKRFISLASSRDHDDEFPQDMLKKFQAIESLLSVADATAQEISELTTSYHNSNAKARLSSDY